MAALRAEFIKGPKVGGIDYNRRILPAQSLQPLSKSQFRVVIDTISRSTREQGCGRN